MTHHPVWTLGTAVPSSAAEWKSFGRRLEAFVTQVLGVRKSDFAEAFGVTRTTASRWFRGCPMDLPYRNLLDHVSRLAQDVTGPKALELVGKRREAYAAEARTSPAGLPEALSRIEAQDTRIARLEQAVAGLMERDTGP